MMKLKNILIVCAAVAMVFIPSCKDKDDDTESLPYLDGSVKFSMPLYVLPEKPFSLTPTGAKHPDGGGIGYFWYSSWDSTRDTVKREDAIGDGTWSFSTPAETGEYTITATAFAKNYSSLSFSMTFVVVDPSIEGSLKGAGYQTDSVTFTDPRDNAVYYLTTSGGKVWMQNNLFYPESGVSFFYCDAIDPIVGRLYSWNEAVSVCPEGWHLPSDAEFAALAGIDGDSYTRGAIIEGCAGSLMADVYFNGTKMWTFWPQVKITNSSKFSAVPIGYAVDQEDSQKFNGANAYAVFWTSDSDGDSGIYRYIYEDKTDVYCAKGDKKSFRASVRCVKD